MRGFQNRINYNIFIVKKGNHTQFFPQFYLAFFLPSLLFFYSFLFFCVFLSPFLPFHETLMSLFHTRKSRIVLISSSRIVLISSSSHTRLQNSLSYLIYIPVLACFKNPLEEEATQTSTYRVNQPIGRERTC